MINDKFGFYTVGNLKTYSKYEAFQVGTPIWNFNDDVFSSIDWKINPSFELSKLYKIRAQQIRDKYDHIVLWYSGGSDSHNILRTFIDNDIKLDEVASITEYDITGNKDTYNNSEIYIQVLSDIKELLNTNKFKFRLVEIGKIALEILNDPKYNYNLNYSFSPIQVARQFLREKIKDWKDIIDSGKRLVFVWGKEKPFINTYNNKKYCIFRDNIDDCVGPYVQNKHNSGWFDELFYWTPDMPLLIIKMAHTLKTFIETCDDPIFYKRKLSVFGFNPNIQMWIKDETAKKLLYPHWSNTRFDLGKPTSFVYSERDHWLWSANNEETTKFNKNIIKYLNIANITSPKENILKLAPCYSKKYWLE